MNKLQIGLTVVTCAITLFFLAQNNKILTRQSSQESERQSITEKHGNNSSKLSEQDNHDVDSAINTHKHNDEAGFDFTPYVSKEMADEIRPYTSRSHDGLNVKMDKDGHEYVDLKKRWSHATISVIDENGEKQTGEWAPEN